MKIVGIDHIQLAMPEHGEEKAREFYINLLGFHEIPKPTDLAKRGGVWFQFAEVQLHLGVEKDFRPTKKGHPAFLVDNLSDFIYKAKSLGIEIDNSQPELEGFRRVHLFDPFGNRIEFVESVA